MTHPSDLLAHNGFLYIPDLKRHKKASVDRQHVACIWQILLPLVDGCKPETKQLTSEDDGISPFALSLSHDGRIIITTLSNAVFIYRPDRDSAPIRQFTLPSDVVCRPEHTIHLMEAWYMLIQCPKELPGQLFQQMIKFRLDELQSCVIPSSIEQCNVSLKGRPGHLAQISCSNNIIIADRKGDKIFAFNLDRIQEDQKVILDTGTTGPCRMAYYEYKGRGRLLVGGDQSVGLFDFSIASTYS